MTDLGMIDPKTECLELSIAGKDYTITQSPGLLRSNREQGTTGAAAWQTSVRVAEWLAWPKNPLFEMVILDSNSMVLELGSGVSGVVACTIAPKVGSVIATDQHYLLKHLQSNIEANTSGSTASSVRKVRKSGKVLNVGVLALDWEEDDVQKQLTSYGPYHGVDVVIGCDCIYNYALIQPFVQTCADICRLRQQAENGGDDSSRPTACIIAQHLRQSDVFEQWLATSMRLFRIWRVQEGMLTDGLKYGSGFAVHVLLLR